MKNNTTRKQPKKNLIHLVWLWWILMY